VKEEEKKEEEEEEEEEEETTISWRPDICMLLVPSDLAF
jgi:hypothetical protein